MELMIVTKMITIALACVSGLEQVALYTKYQKKIKPFIRLIKESLDEIGTIYKTDKA